jgi:hypothetical protein
VKLDAEVRDPIDGPVDVEGGRPVLELGGHCGEARSAA